MKLYEAIEYLEGMRVLFPGGPGAESIDIAIECIMKEIQRRAIAKNDLDRMMNDLRRRARERMAQKRKNMDSGDASGRKRTVDAGLRAAS